MAYSKLRKILKTERYDFISCNTPAAGVSARLAARDVRKQGTKVYYTAHGFHFYKGAPKINWLLYYPIERLMAHFTDTLITITKEDYRLAKPNFDTNVVHIHGVGADEGKFLSVDENQNNMFRKEQGYDDRFIILCVGELNKNKNQKTVINAVRKVSRVHPEVLLLLAGNGPTDEELREQITSLNMQHYVRMLGYCTDLEKYTNACDILVSASFREGMPLNIMEAMMCGKPVIASNNRGHRELIHHFRNGLIFNAEDYNALGQYIEQLVEDSTLRSKLGTAGRKSVKPYLNRNVEKELKEIYNL
jgi:glycosyltransferase EpsD